MGDKALRERRCTPDDDLDLMIREDAAEIRFCRNDDSKDGRLELLIGEHGLGCRAGEDDGHVLLEITEPTERSATITASLSDQHHELLDAAFCPFDRRLVDDPSEQLRRDDMTCLVGCKRMVGGVSCQSPILSGGAISAPTQWGLFGLTFPHVASTAVRWSVRDAFDREGVVRRKHKEAAVEPHPLHGKPIDEGHARPHSDPKPH